MKNPDLFSTCVAMSAGTFTDEEIINNSQYDQYFGSIYGAKPQGEVSKHWKANSPLHLLESVDKEKLKSIRFYIDCGDDDFLYEGNSLVHIEMRKKEIPHEFRIRDGAHNWTYWRESLPVVLSFISDTFHQH